MKTLKSYIIGAMALTAVSWGLTACQDHFDEPDMGEAPVATLQANTTIAEFKEMMWQTSDNYCEEVYTKEWHNTAPDQRTEEMKTEGTHIVIKGRVVSSDFAGNCFKYIVLQDETGALNFSIDSYNLYLNYRRGQEILVDLTGMYAGKYRGLEQVGFPSFNSSLNGDETSFMGPQVFNRHRELNGFPNLADIDTITVNSISELGVTPEELRKWQSQLIRINNVAFVPDDVPTLSEYHSSGVSHNIQDADGNTIAIRTSGYANFWNMEVPETRGDIVAILGYYATIGQSGAWQLTLLDAASLMNFGHPTVPSGSQGNPYTVAQAIALQANGDGANGWVRGYIVGTVAPEVETVTSSSDIEWGAEPILGNTMVIAPEADCTDVAQCLVVALPQNTAIYNQSLLKNPANYKKQIDIRGNFGAVMGTFGLSTPGADTDFTIEGMEPVKPAEGDGSEENPYLCSQIIAMAPSSTTVAVESGVWVKGYIVGYYENYEAHFSTSSSQRANILIADASNASNASSCVCIQLVANTETRTALNLVDNPGVLGQSVQVFGDIMKYNTLPGVKNTSNYKLDGNTTTPDEPVNPGTPEGAGTAESPFNVTAALAAAKALSSDGKLSAYAKGTVKSITELSTSFGNATYIITDGSCDLQVYRGYGLNGDKFTAEDQLAVGAEVVVSGDLVNYMGNTPQFTTGSQIVSYNGETGGGDTPNPPTPPVADDYKGNFNSFNDGTPKSSYGTYTNATGWTAENCAILGGFDGEGDGTNPRFAFIGSESTLAPTLNGKAGAAGKLTSPTLTGGCGTLTFSYGFAFNETTDTKFTVNILQNGTVVKTQTVTVAKADWEKFKVYDFSWEVNVTGDFSIEIVNDCASQATANKERVSIWNLTWN